MSVYKDPVLADNLTISPGGSKSTEIVDLDKARMRCAIGYHINSSLGSPKVTLMIQLGTDVNGNPVWVPQQSSTSNKDSFLLDWPSKQVKLKVEETGGADGLDGIKAWAVAESD